jgi:hypothetical protein
MTLHDAQTAVAAIRERNNLSPIGWDVRWDDPVKEATRYALRAAEMPFADLEKAANEIAAALFAYYAHLHSEAGQRAATDAILAYADRDMGVPLYSFANDVREGLHYAEPEGA